MIRLLQDAADARAGARVPDTIEEHLDHGEARCVAFNRRGTLLATGCHSGDVVLWDFETRGVSRVLSGGHTGEVVSLSWSRDGRRLASACLNSQLRVWDVLAAQPSPAVKLAGKPLTVQLHPQKSHLALVCCQGEPAVLVDLTSGTVTPLPFGTPDADAAATAAAAPAPAVAGRKASSAAAAGSLASSGFAALSRLGDVAFVGSSQGTLAAVGVDDLRVRECIRVGTGAAVRSLCVSRSGGVLLVLSADRVLRAFDVAAPGFRGLREFRDAVNRGTWRGVALSADGEYVAATAQGSSDHLVHVWSLAAGALECVLEGPVDAGAGTAVAWHPVAPLLVSLSTKGRAYVWARTATENWSAFAPDFRELEENEEYVEREDEFDAPLAPSGAPASPTPAQQPCDADVDVLTPHPAIAAADDDEPADALHYLPLVVEAAVAAPQQLPADAPPPAEPVPADEAQEDDRAAKRTRK